MIRRKRKTRPWSNTVSATGWGESTFAEIAWDRSRGASLRWAVAGVLLGAVAALIVYAPAAWLARAVDNASNGHVLLADARGSLWAGSAVAVLTGGADSRDASALPGRIEWTLGLRGLGLELGLRHACCLNGTVAVQVRPGLGRVSAALVPNAGWVGQWPSAWLAGLGTPWNTMQLGGTLRLVSPGLNVESAQGRWRLEGNAEVEMLGVSSRLTTLDALGSYRLGISGDDSGTPQLQLSTQEGALQLSGDGTWGPGGMRFRGEARAAGPADEPALTNLLNIIGRRSGARSVISIG